jgi:hypothetical protein
VRKWSNSELYSLLVGMQQGETTLEDSLAVLPYNQQLSSLVFIQMNQKLCPHKNL